MVIRNLNWKATSAIPFLLMALSVVDARWSVFNFL